jgi:phosphatidylserine/phosphatidylglycerophosphate/cardiolipin synthase-like enzyme
MGARNVLVVGLLASVAACSGSKLASTSSGADAGNDAASANDPRKDDAGGAAEPGSDGGGACTSDCDGGAAPVLTEYFSTPEPTLTQIIALIGSAKKSIQMIMYWITLPDLASALAAAAQRGVDVQVIYDQNNWTTSTPASIQSTLLEAGVAVTPSSTGFSITHCKAMLIDGTTTMIGSINLIETYETTRDHAVVTSDPGVAQEFAAVFAQDLLNAIDGGTATPPLSSPYLVWSPVNSTTRLVSLIESATKTLEVTVENLSDKAVINALAKAAASGVTVRVLTPECDLGESLFNFPATDELDAKGVEARVMSFPAPAFESVTQPYIHAKMIIADQQRAFVGSENFSDNSLEDAREVGIIVTDPGAISLFESEFNADFAYGIVPPVADASVVNCPADPSLGE